MIPLHKLRSMSAALDKMIAEIGPYADGDFHVAWSDKDQALRSLHEAQVYIDSWAYYRKLHRRDPEKGE